MTNMPILYRNIMDGLPSDFARDVFLWAAERAENDPYLYKTEEFAREVHELVSKLGGLMDARKLAVFRAASSGVSGTLLSDEQEEDLLAFILTRHANLRMGGNVRPEYVDRLP